MVLTKKEAKPRTESQRLSSTGVEHIAKLARLGLSESEKKKYSKELSEILDYIDKLNKVETKNVEPFALVSGLKNILRKDEDHHSIDVEKIKKIIGQAPQREGNFLKTHSILEK